MLEGEFLHDEHAYIYEQRSRYRLVQELFQAPTPVTFYLIGLIVLVYAWCLYLDYQLLGVFAGDPKLSIFYGANWGPVIRGENQWWRTLSSVFLHGGLIHILFNGYALYVLGPTVERLSGGARFFIIVIAAGIGGALASYVGSGAPSVGISGSVFGIVGALLGIIRKFRAHLPDEMAARIRRGMIQIALINLGIGFVVPVIDNAAHIGGFVAGFLVALLMNSRLNETAGQASRARAFAVILAGIAAWSLVMMYGEAQRCSVSESAFENCYAPYFQVQERAGTDASNR